jgi:two-component system OmpR family response regulator
LSVAIGDAGRESLDPQSGDVLVVDDFPDSLALYEALLGEDGHRVRTAVSGKKALVMIDEREPDVVLLDVSMPGMDGPATMAALRAQDGSAHVPVVFFTAASTDVELARLLALGAAGVVAKPFDVADLPRRIRSILAKLTPE